jgi:membrane protein insertase Oxa1/YidC/SpoIIIJ
MFTIFGVPVDAAYHLVSGFAGILAPVLGGAAAVAAIIAVTMAVRIVLMPLSLRALRALAPLAAGIYLLASMGWSLAERRFFFRRAAGSRGDQGAQQPDRR